MYHERERFETELEYEYQDDEERTVKAAVQVEFYASNLPGTFIDPPEFLLEDPKVLEVYDITRYTYDEHGNVLKVEQLDGDAAAYKEVAERVLAESYDFWCDLYDSVVGDLKEPPWL